MQISGNTKGRRTIQIIDSYNSPNIHIFKKVSLNALFCLDCSLTIFPAQFIDDASSLVSAQESMRRTLISSEVPPIMLKCLTCHTKCVHKADRTCQMSQKRINNKMVYIEALTIICLASLDCKISSAVSSSSVLCRWTETGNGSKGCFEVL